jgi:hypothetical protein
MIMSNNDDYMQNTVKYIRTVLSCDVNIKPTSHAETKKLPLSITSNYRLYMGDLLSTAVCLLSSSGEFDFSPNQRRKQMQLVQTMLSVPVIFIIEKVASYNIHRLIAQRINFIIPGKQMFIPELLIDLKKQKSIADQTEKQITPVAQCILLYHLEKSPLNNFTSKDLCKLFNVSYATINRAIRWLIDNKLIRSTTSKERRIDFVLDGKELWNKIGSYLISPIERVIYTDQIIDSLCKSGINALSAYSMLNEQSNMHYAVSKEGFKTLEVETDAEYGENLVEIWRYNPELLSNSGIVDKLSLYLSLKDTKDERVQIELENMINEMEW